MKKAILATVYALTLSASIFASMAASAPWELTGTWRLAVKCKDFNQTNNVTIGKATATKVMGTTNVDDGFGKIVSGHFDGVSFVFTNRYKWNGHNYSEAWTGKLSRSGNYMSGAFTTNNTDAGGCSFKGPRVE